MFAFTHTPVMFTGLLILFAWCTGWSLVELIGSRTASERLMNGLHLFMSVIMLVMVPAPTWKALTSVVPIPWLAGVFGAAAVWFLVDAVRGHRHADHAGHGRHLLAHALMFAAMAWHLLGMQARMGPMMTEHGGGHAMTAGPSAALIVAWVGVPFMAALLVMGIADLLGALRSGAMVRTRAHRTMGMAMNLGMFWMSVGLIAPLLPWMSLLQR